MAKVKIGNRADFLPGKLNGVNVNGRMFLVVNLDGKLFVVDGNCTHEAGHLWEGTLQGSTVRCPNHGTEYDVRTGKMTRTPRYPFATAYDLKSYPVTVEGEDVLIDTA